MHSTVEIKQKVNQLLHEKLFAAIRKIIVDKQRDRFVKTTEYLTADNFKKRKLLDENYKVWYESVSKFFLSYHSIYALLPLVDRELKIRTFSPQKVIRIKADYLYDDVEFSTFYPSRFNESNSKEIEDCIAELKNKKYPHIVSDFKIKTDTERAPSKPLTTAELKFSCFYLFGFSPKYVSELANILFEANLITNPETNGWEIDNLIVEDIITVLNQRYNEEQVLQYKRSYLDNNVDRTAKECIRPVVISSDFFPKNIINVERFRNINFEDNRKILDTKQLYEFIFYITLSTQLKNSVYDTSSIEITSGDKKLLQQSYELIKGQDNWELLSGGFLKRIEVGSDSNFKQTIVLPKIEPQTELQALDIYQYLYNSKRPPRYGVGRFVTQILEKYAIGANREHDDILNNLLESKALIEIKHMLYPQENAIILIEWFTEHLPTFLDLDYMRELEEKIQLVADGELMLSSVLEEVDRLIEASFNSSGFVFDDAKPSDAKIRLLKLVALKHSLSIDKRVFDSNVKIDIYLAKYPIAEPIKVGSCPSCNSLVFQKEYIKEKTGEVIYYFSCEKFDKTNGCNFSIWDSYIHKYFSDKAKELYTIEERATVLRKILSKKNGYLFNNFIAKNSKPYDAKVFVSQYEDRKTKKQKWGFDLNFVKKKR